MPRPVHFEIQAQDPARAQAFYEGLFGWSFQKWGDQPYWLIKTGEGSPGIDGGMLPRMGGAPDAGAPLPVIAWVCTVDVPDLDPFVEKAKALGGENVVPKMPIPGVGWLAYCKDTEGNIFGMMQNDPNAA
jgi:hypothetical protein